MSKHVAEKRRLPVLNSPKADPDEETRPAWQWVGFGVVIILAAWLPLAYLAEFVKGRIIKGFLGPVETEDQATLALAALSSADRARLTIWLIGLPALGLAAGALAGGYVVGRWGEKAGWREAAAAGATVGVLSGVLAFVSATPPASEWLKASFTALAPIVLAMIMAGLGGLRGSRRKAP